jgi:hypothetical protein
MKELVHNREISIWTFDLGDHSIDGTGFNEDP